MESFQYLTDNIPSWVDKVDLLSKQVNERRIEFNRLSQTSGISIPPIQKQKTGSTESLRPVEFEAPTESHAIQTDTAMPPPQTPTTPPIHIDIDPNNKRLFQDHRNRARRKRKSASLLSGASGPQRFRSRMSIIVYYDSSIQEGFEWLVGRVASAGNTLRKGKMMASHKARLASLTVDESPFDGARTDMAIRNPRIPRFQRSSTPFSIDSLALQPFELIEKDLEAAQTLCEVGAHQFLRDADCIDELATIRDHFENSMKISREQVELLREEEERKKSLHENASLGEAQRRPLNSAPESNGIEIDTLTPETTSYHPNSMGIEIDEDNDGGIEVDKGIEIDDVPVETNGGGLSNGLIEVDDTHPTSNSGGLVAGMIEVDDSPEDDAQFEIDLAAFRRTRATRSP
ncbi:hypothetical protein MMC10_005337 [Thelotrema lepadinum]|nr:hypothetical protein [Thelotrema lepadinum]